MENSVHQLKIIAHIENDFDGKFGIPRQSGLCQSIESRIIFSSEYRNPDALRGIEEFSHLWLIWEFSENVRNKFTPTVRPPRLGGNERKGVFATRSPFRPNSLGLSCVKLERVEHTEKQGDILVVSGADLMNGTPIFDVKPYIPYADCKPQATGSFAEEEKNYRLEVKIDEEMLAQIPENKRSAVREILALDPRPAYQDDPQRIYGFEFAGLEIKFTVRKNILIVKEVSPAKS